ncbi:MAG TPA: LPXTG cell wall anchor domain-containing protein [Symbiobacteriaceae bacterium]|nr:LPXTG cell wall anchor domain-containing protein [Symbiobacteriaceae bacterium]
MRQKVLFWLSAIILAAGAVLPAAAAAAADWPAYGAGAVGAAHFAVSRRVSTTDDPSTAQPVATVRGGGAVYYFYTVYNTGTVPLTITSAVDDRLGPVDFSPATVPPGGTATAYKMKEHPAAAGVAAETGLVTVLATAEGRPLPPGIASATVVSLGQGGCCGWSATPPAPPPSGDCHTPSFPCQPRGGLSGRICAPGAPGAEILAVGPGGATTSVTIPSNGQLGYWRNWVLGNLVPGLWQLTLKVPGKPAATQTVTVSAGATSQVPDFSSACTGDATNHGSTLAGALLIAAGAAVLAWRRIRPV